MEQPPIDTPEALSAYLKRVLEVVEDRLENTGKLPIRTLMPPKPVQGKLYYFGRAIAPNIPAEGLYIYDMSDTWKQVSYEDD